MSQYDKEREWEAMTGAANALGPSTRTISFREQLTYRIKEHKEQIERMEKLVKLLDENPAIEEFMNLSDRVRL